MDKLKPILAQKFWIFFGIVLIMPMVGYFMSKGTLADQIKSRWDALNSVYGSIPSGTGSPNETWEQGVNVLNEQRALQNRLAHEALWQMQAVKMRWPQEIADVMKKAEYFKPVPPEAGGIDVPFKYPHSYPRELLRLWEIVDPIDDGKNLRDSDKRRKIAFAMADLHQAAGWQSWPEFAPSFDKIWAAQEDIWLQTELLQAIARVNRTAISQGDADIKQLGKITLFGGKKSTGAPSTSPGATISGGEPSFSEGNPAFGSMGPMGPMGSGGRTEAALSADINLAEEFEVSLESQGGARGAMGSFVGSENASATTTGGASTEVQRYIDNDEASPFKRRGFYFKVVMNHRKVPELIAELMNSPFPVEIVRIHQVWYHNPNATSSGSGSPFTVSSGSGAASPFGSFPSAESFGASPETTIEASTDASSGIFGSGSPMGRPGASGSGSLAAMADPNLAEVAILGVWTLYRPPAPAAGGAQPTPTASPAPAVTGSPAAPVAPAAATAAPASAAESATTPIPPVTSSEDSNQPDNSNSPASTPQKPAEEKSDSNPTPTSPSDAVPKANATGESSEKESGAR
jgi:hypothetical protein